MRTSTPTSEGERTKEPGFFSLQVLSAQRFFLDLQPPATSRLAVVCGGVEHCDPSYHVARKTFEYYSLEFVARGEGELVLDGKRAHLSPGVVFSYGPGIAHDMRSDRARPLVKYFVDFAAKPAFRSPPLLGAGQVARTSTPDVILRLFDELVMTGVRATPLRDRLCAAILEQLMLRVAESAVGLGNFGARAFETFQQCRRHINENHLVLRDLADVSRGCGVDRAYLCRMFARFERQSPYRYLMHLKMREAARRLATPGTLAKQVAREMGFSDPFHFSRVFRRMIGVSPSEFVRLHRPVSTRE